jgi:uncharacterized protein (DUF302 family)
MIDGLITTESPLDAAATLAWLEVALDRKGVTIFARIDHAAGADAIGLPLPPTTVLIFGNAQAGTKLMQVDQRIGIDLPLRALVWTDAVGTTHISYNDPAWIAARYGDALSEMPVIGAMKALLSGLATGLTGAR